MFYCTLYFSLLHLFILLVYLHYCSLYFFIVFYILYALYLKNEKVKVVHLHFCKMHKCKCIFTSSFVYITCLFALLFAVFYSLYSLYFNINKWSDHLYALGRNVNVKCSLLYLFFALLFIVFYIVHCIWLCSASHSFSNKWCNRKRAINVRVCHWTGLSFCPLQDSGCNCACLFSDRDQTQVYFTTSTEETFLDRLKRSSFSQRDKMITFLWALSLRLSLRNSWRGSFLNLRGYCKTCFSCGFGEVAQQIWHTHTQRYTGSLGSDEHVKLSL